MALVDSLLTAMVRADGDALVMHVGERPIVVSGARTIDLSNHGMNLGAMVGMLGQLLSHDAQIALKEFGAVEHELPSREADHFSVVAARSGDDIWIEIRRRREVLKRISARAHPELPQVAAEPAQDETAAVAEERSPAPAPDEAAISSLPDAASADDVQTAEQAVSEAAAAATAETTPAESIDDQEHAAPELIERASTPTPVAETETTELLELESPPAPEESTVPEADTDVPVLIAEAAAEEQPSSFDRVESATLPELTTRDEPVTVAPDRSLVESAAAWAEPSVAEPEDAPAPEPEAVEPAAAYADHSPDEQLAEPASELPEVVDDLPAVAHAADRVEAASPVESLAPAAMAEATDQAARQEAAVRPVLASASASLHAGSALASGTSMDAPRLQGQSAAGSPPADTTAPAAPPGSVAPPPAENGTSVSDAPVTRTVRIEVPARAASRSEGLDRLLRAADAAGASELFVVSQVRPYVRVGGNVRALQDEPLLLAADIDALISDVTPEPWRDAVRRGDPAEWLIEVAEVGRVRCATFRDHRGPGANFHFAFLRAATADDLQLSPETRLLATEPDGLVLVSGLAGSDVSAIVAAFVDLLNQQRADYIITLEPQVRVLHVNRQALVSQREVGADPVRSADSARAALREQPDVLVIESLATSDMAHLAIEAASQERLVIASVEAPSAPAAVQRFVELLPADHRPHSREQLSRCFRGAVAQLVLRKTTGGRVAARELLTSTRAVARILLEGEVARLADQLEAGGARGLAPLTDTLVDYVRSGMVDVREAVRKAPDADRLVERLRGVGADLSALDRWS